VSYKDKEPEKSIDYIKEFGKSEEELEKMCQQNPNYKMLYEETKKRKQEPSEILNFMDFTDNDKEITKAIDSLQVAGNHASLLNNNYFRRRKR